MTKREFLDTVFALAPNEANAIMDAFDEYVESNVVLTGRSGKERRMTKYIIDIPDDVQYVLLNGKADNKCYTAVRPVAELEELNSDYINENFGELQEAYQAGLNDAWEAAKKLSWTEKHGGYGECLDKVFDRTDTFDFLDYSPNEAIEKLKAYDDKQKDRIEVGDEVRARDGAPSHTFLVTKVTDSHVYGISDDGSWNYWTKDEVKKTGKHYDIASILEAMRT